MNSTYPKVVWVLQGIAKVFNQNHGRTCLPAQRLPRQGQGFKFHPLVLLRTSLNTPASDSTLSRGAGLAPLLVSLLMLVVSASLATIAVGVVVAWTAPAESPIVVGGCVRAAIYRYRKSRGSRMLARVTLEVKVQIESICEC